MLCPLIYVRLGKLVHVRFCRFGIANSLRNSVFLHYYFMTEVDVFHVTYKLCSRRYCDKLSCFFCVPRRHFTCFGNQFFLCRSETVQLILRRRVWLWKYSSFFVDAIAVIPAFQSMFQIPIGGEPGSCAVRRLHCRFENWFFFFLFGDEFSGRGNDCSPVLRLVRT